MKKYILCLMALLSTFGLKAKEDDAVAFTAFGSTWLQANIGANVISGEYGNYSDSESGVAASVEMNLGLISLMHIGFDVGFTLDYNNVEFSDYASMDTCSAYIEVKPYINLYRGEDFGLTLFFNPFAGYRNIDLEALGTGISKDGAIYGIKTGVEIAFFSDFYITPAYRYTRVEPFDSDTSGYDENSAEIELAYRLNSWISFHLTYAHILEKEYFKAIKLSNDEVLVGVRLAF